MAAYKVFYKDYANKKGVFLGVLTEVGKSLNEESPLESVLRSARLVYANKVKDKKDIYVVPTREMHISLLKNWPGRRMSLWRDESFLKLSR